MTQKESNGLLSFAKSFFGSSRKDEQVASSGSFSGQLDFSTNNLSGSTNSFDVNGSATTITFARVPKGEIGQTEKTVTAFTNAGMESEGPILRSFAYKKYQIFQVPLPRSIKSNAFSPSSEAGFSERAILLYKKVRSSTPTYPLEAASDSKTLVVLRSTDLVQRGEELDDYEITAVIDEEIDIEAMLRIQEGYAPSIGTDFPQIPEMEEEKKAA